jgi:MOSC domain-containing protein YiiM
MGIVIISGEVQPGQRIKVELPPKPHHPLGVV